MPDQLMEELFKKLDQFSTLSKVNRSGSSHLKRTFNEETYQYILNEFRAKANTLHNVTVDKNQ
jgi:uncharacterized protein YlbG (UPF0298 family)